MKLPVLMLAAAVAFGFGSGAQAGDKVNAVASFSILGDMAREVGGDRVKVTTLVGPDGDAHVFSPTPADAKALAGANLEGLTPMQAFELIKEWKAKWGK